MKVVKFDAFNACDDAGAFVKNSALYCHLSIKQIKDATFGKKAFGLLLVLF